MSNASSNVNGERTTYTISLDELDLATFPVMSNNSNNGLLWSLNNNKMDNNNYYQFSLNISEDDEISTKSQPALSMYKCYICNLNIPTSFKNEHLNSAKHKVCLDIANNALERIKKSFNETVSPKEPTLDNISLHFCTICNTVMKKSEKSKHETSKLHKVSVIHERMVVDFAKLYCNDSSNENSNTSATENLNLTENNSSKIVTEVINIDMTNNQYLNMLKEKFKSDKFLKKVICIGNSIQFETNNGEQVLVKETHFFGDNQEGCALCDIAQCDFKAHKFTQSHMIKLTCRINNKGMRIVTLTTGHCLICNKFISSFPNMVKHQELHDMEDNADNFIKNNGVDVKTTENKTFKNVTKKKQHTDNIQNNSKASLGKPINVVNREPLPNFDIKKYPTIELFNNIHVKCKTCKNVVPNNENNVIEHLNGSSHKKNALSINKENVLPKASTSTDQVEETIVNKSNEYEKHGVIQTKPGVFFCNACLVNIPENSVIEHVLGKKHVKNQYKLDFPDLNVPINIVFD